MTHDQPGGRSKLLGLELIRFTCAMTVLIWHYRHFAMVGDGAAMLRPHEPLTMLLWPAYEFGLFGVQIFWCISGFIFYWNYAEKIAARRIGPKRFFWLRFSRLYPLHFVTLLVVAGLQPLYGALAGQPFIYKDQGIINFLLHLGLADQWTGPRPESFNGPIWSVSAEVFVYVAFFMLVRTFGRARWLIFGAIGAALLSIWSGATSTALICGGYFFAGGAAAECLRSERVRQHLRAACIVAAAMAGAAIAVGTAIDLGDQLRIMPTWLMAICPPLLFLAAQDMPALDRWQKTIQAAGNLTYSTYLIHFPVQLGVAIAALASGIALPVSEAWFLIAYLATIVALGRIIFLRFEAPMQAWIRAATLAPAPARATT
ncbi:MAG: acyltransferase [Sphingomicrobium sp.]